MICSWSCHRELLKLCQSPALMKLLNGKLLLFPSHCPQNFIPFILNRDISGTAKPEELPWGATAQILVLTRFWLSLSKARSQPGWGFVAGAEFRRRKSWFGECSWAGLCPQEWHGGSLAWLGMLWMVQLILWWFSSLPPGPPSFLEDICVSHHIPSAPFLYFPSPLLFLTLQIFKVLFFFFFFPFWFLKR